jgi:hypothetical protein
MAELKTWNPGNMREDSNGAVLITTISAGPRVQTPTGDVTQVQIGPGDVISSIPVVIEFDHHQLHEGETWQYSNFGTLNSATKDIRISVPVLTATTKTPHMLPEVVCDCTSAQILLYEDTTWTAGGVDASGTIYNRNRNVAGTANTKLYVSGTTALTPNALGNLLTTGYVFSGAKGAMASDRAVWEWDLKSNTEYLFRVTTVGNGNCLIRLNWYEDKGV